MRTLRLGMAQINCTVGDLEGNRDKICEYIEEARKLEVDLLSFPELAITGYPPEDLLLKPQFIKDNLSCLAAIIKHTKDIAVVVGFVDCRDDIYNAAAVIHDGTLAGVYHKMYLPNYGVFDEKRYFQVGSEYPVFVIYGVTVGVNICEDIWYPDGPAMVQALGGAEVIVNINSSPYHAGKWQFRERMLATRASDYGVILAYNNMVGGQDELVFDGHGIIFDPGGNLIVMGKQFEEDLAVADLDIGSAMRIKLHDPRWREEKLGLVASGKVVNRMTISEMPPVKKRVPLPKRELAVFSGVAEIYQALILGVRDYVHKNGFKKVIIGLSGGIDSVLTVTLAVDALDKENVVGVFMPSEYSSEASKEDAQQLAKNLGIKFMTIPIQDIFVNYLNTLAEPFEGLAADVTEENIQARIRGNILMALSNKFGWLVLTTGNKSEMSVGYATLYGDMSGGFAVLKDVPKTLVYELANYRNSLGNKELIPQRILRKEPTAELKPGQRDTDALPPYEVLDPILRAYVEEDRGFEEILRMGYNEEVVEKVAAMVDRSEYKRRQTPPGVKITPRALGKDRRMPITNRYKSF